MSLFRVCDELGFWSRDCLQSWFSLVWITATAPLYLMVLLVVVRNKNDKLGKPFFKLIVSLGVADLLNLLSGFLIYRPVYVYGWWPERWYVWAGSTGVRFYGVITSLSAWAQKLGCLAISANRFTVLVVYGKHSMIWSNIRSVIVVQWVLSAALTAPLFFVSFELHDVNPNSTSDGRFYMWYTYPQDLSLKVALESVLVFFIILGIVTLYSITFYSAWSHAKEVSPSVNPNDNTIRKGALNLAVCGLLITVCMLFGSSVDIYARIIWHGFKFDMYKIKNAIKYLVIDLYGGLNPWVLLGMCSAVREEFIETYRVLRIYRPPLHSNDELESCEMAHFEA